MKRLSLRGPGHAVVVFLALVLVVLIFAFVVTWGRRGLFDAPLGYVGLISPSFYDEQARALVSGRLDVPCSATGDEAFVISGKCHGYYGLTPALLRIPLRALFPRLEGRWSRFMLLTASLLSAVAAAALGWRFLRTTDKPNWEKLTLLLVYFLAFALGGSSVFLLGNPWTYHEAVAWGAAFSLLAFLTLDIALARDSAGWLAAATVLGAAAANARVTVGLGPLIAVGTALALTLAGPCGRAGLHRWGPKLPRWQAAILLGFVLAATATPFVWNGVRFGSPSPPLEKMINYAKSPARLEQARKGLLSPGNLPCTLSAYWSPRSIETRESFPWLRPGIGLWQLPDPYPDSLGACRGSTVNYADPVLAIPYAMPAQLLLVLLGISAARRWRDLPWKRYLAPALGAAAAAVPIHLYHTISYRYVHDLYPLWAILGTAGIVVVAGIRLRTVRWALVGVLLMGTLWGLFMNVSAGLTHTLPQPEAIELLIEVRRAGR